MLGSVRPVRALFFTMDNAIIAQLERIRGRFNELTEEMARPEIAADFEQSNKLARERAEVEDVVHMFADYEAARKAADEAQALMADGDAEMKELAEVELAEANAVDGGADREDPARAPSTGPTRFPKRHRRDPGRRRGRGSRSVRLRTLPCICPLRGAEALGDRDPQCIGIGEGRLQGSRVRSARRRRLLPPEVRERGPPRAACPGDRSTGAHPYFHGDRRRPPRSRRSRCRYRGEGRPGRHLPCLRGRRAERQQGRHSGAAHAPSDRNGRRLPGRTFPAEEPDKGDDRPSLAPVRRWNRARQRRK